MNAESQLHNAQVRTQVTTGCRHIRHDELANFLRELLQLLVAEVLQVCRGLNTREQLGSGTIANAVVSGGAPPGALFGVSSCGNAFSADIHPTPQGWGTAHSVRWFFNDSTVYSAKKADLCSRRARRTGLSENSLK